jgi:hypothetical protein
MHSLLNEFYRLTLPDGWQSAPDILRHPVVKEENHSCILQCNPLLEEAQTSRLNTIGELIAEAEQNSPLEIFPKLSSSDFPQPMRWVIETCQKAGRHAFPPDFERAILPLAQMHLWAVPLMDAIADDTGVQAGWMVALQDLMTRQRPLLPSYRYHIPGSSGVQGKTGIREIVDEFHSDSPEASYTVRLDGESVFTVQGLSQARVIPLKQIRFEYRGYAVGEEVVYDVVNALHCAVTGQVKLYRCKECGMVFQKQDKGPSPKFCSTACKNRWNSALYYHENNEPAVPRLRHDAKQQMDSKRKERPTRL